MQLYPGCAQPDLQCCLLSKRQWWSLIQHSFSTRFLALNCVETRQSPTHQCPKPSRLKTQPRQPRRKIMFWFLSHKNKHSFQVKPLSYRELYSWSCSEPTAPTGWSSEGHIWLLKAQTFLTSLSSVTERQITCRIPGSHSWNQEIQSKLVCNWISEGVYSPLKTFTYKRESPSTQAKHDNTFCITVPPVTEIAQNLSFCLQPFFFFF